MDKNNLQKVDKQTKKAMIILVSGPWIIICGVGGFQTIEWHLIEGTSIPLIAYVMLLVVAVWCSAAITVPGKKMGEAIKKFEKMAERLF